jgi:hypothetical protein
LVVRPFGHPLLLRLPRRHDAGVQRKGRNVPLLGNVLIDDFEHQGVVDVAEAEVQEAALHRRLELGHLVQYIQLGEPEGSIQGTFREHSGNIQRILREHLRIFL